MARQKFMALRAGSKERVEVTDAQRFSVVIGGDRFWFAVHNPTDGGAGMAVSHWPSGKCLTTVTPTQMLATIGMKAKQRAVLAIGTLINAHGEQVVHDALVKDEDEAHAAEVKK